MSISTPDLSQSRRFEPQQARSHEKLERLLVAGKTLFAERGFEGTKISDVAKRARCSVGVFYQRFADKDAFFHAVQERFIADTLAATDELVSSEDLSRASTRELVQTYVERAVDFFRRNEGLHRAFLHYESSHPGADAPMLRLAHATTAMIAGTLLKRRDEIGHPDPELAVHFALQVVQGTLVRTILHQAGPLRLSDERLVPELVRVVTGYLGLGARAPRRAPGARRG